MNFFGHAVVASRRHRDPGFVLGSMLPDFATMLRRRPPRSTHPAVESGVAFHHETDAVFHASPTFLRLSQTAYDRLVDGGLARGPARAVAHVGVEILIDSVLAHDGDAVRAYREALFAASPTELGAAIAWCDREAPERFEELRNVLCSREPSRARVAADLVARRLRRALDDRPRLALDDRGEALVSRWCDEVQDSIVEHTEAVIGEVNVGLARRA